jgi:hypothetical protein
MNGRGVLIGAALATGGLLLIPGVAPAVARAARPVVRAAVKTGAAAYQELRQAGAEVYEHFEDAAAEMRADMGETAGAEEAVRTAGPTTPAHEAP